MFIRFLCAAWAALVLVSCGGGSDGSGIDAMLPASPLSASARAPSGPMDPAFLADAVSVVNTTTANDQVLRSVGATQDGGYSVAWISTGQLLFMQAYDSVGATAGSEIRIPLQIDAPTEAASRMAIEQSSVAVLRDGSVVVLYSITRDVAMNGFTSTSTGVFFQIFSANGMHLVPETEVVSQPYAGPKGPSLGPPRIVALSDGGFVVASELTSSCTGCPSTTAVSLHWFNDEGQRVGSPVGVGGFTQVLPDVVRNLVADAHGGLVLSVIGTRSIYEIQYTVFHYSPDHAVALTIVVPQSRPVLLLPLENGYVLFTAAAGGGGATAQMLDNQGNPVGDVSTVPSLPFAARELADGNYFVIWFADGAYAAQLFADDGTSLGKAVPISSNGAAPAIAALAAPAFVAAWSADSANGDSDVYVQRFAEKLSDHRKACLDSARAHGLKGQERKAFVDACMASHSS